MSDLHGIIEGLHQLLLEQEWSNASTDLPLDEESRKEILDMNAELRDVLQPGVQDVASEDESDLEAARMFDEEQDDEDSEDENDGEDDRDDGDGSDDIDAPEQLDYN
jgi:hypothetical protein